MAQGRGGRAKLDTNPYQKMVEEIEKLGDAGANFEHWQAKWHRRTGTSKNYLGQEDAFAMEFVPQIEELTRERYGGGQFTVEFSDPNGIFPKPIVYSFSIAGDPKPMPGEAEKREQGENPFMPSMPPSSRWMPGPGLSSRYGMFFDDHRRSPFPNWSDQVQVFSRGQGSDREGDLKAELAREREKNEKMQGEIASIRADLAEERRRREAEVSEERHRREMQELRSAFDTQTKEILSRLDRDKESSALAKVDPHLEMMKMINDREKESMKMMMDFSQRDIADRRANLDYLSKMNETQMKFLQDQAVQYGKLNDPAKQAEFFDIMGKRTVDMLNIMTEMATSGLFGSGQEEMHPAIKSVLNLVDGLKDFGSKYLQQRQQEAQQQRLRVMQPPPLPVAANPPPAGARPAQPPTPQPQGQPTPPPTQVSVNELLWNDAINQIGLAIFVKKEEPEKVADLMFTHFDYLRFRDGLPENLEDVFEKPEEALMRLMDEAKGQGYEAEEEYVKKIIAAFAQIVEETREDEEDKDGEPEEKAEQHADQPAEKAEEDASTPAPPPV